MSAPLEVTHGGRTFSFATESTKDTNGNKTDRMPIGVTIGINQMMVNDASEIKTQTTFLPALRLNLSNEPHKHRPGWSSIVCPQTTSHDTL